ncbi:hypothetical protein [Holzapfeliella floricola]|uniref:Uncharacterized protein n=1 Tax=Holzapfeliella floricola DSM 23037 = JCM 16512 TaxID=1423744 RepID=A0A0R2DKE2_9LACO|nr:hypothetical protein [Holzapfeliella floricola]KRN04568.1 hypothetical protein FC86_GL000016 [Holzapfeliella floricola DSM 23037 = JCM 16512]
MKTYRSTAWVLLFNAVVNILLVLPMVSNTISLKGLTDVIIALTSAFVLYQSYKHYKLRTINVSSVLLIISAIISWGNIFIVTPRIPSEANALSLLQSQDANLVLVLGAIVGVLRIVAVVFAFIEYHKVMKLERE